ncbi:MAG: DUF3592 domain-containing protein [Phycisphaerales bacterium]
MAGIIVILISAAFGVMMLWVGSTQFLQQRRLLRQVVGVDAVILESKVAGSRSMDTDQRLLRDNSTKSYTPEVKFGYEYQGNRYQSSMLYPTIIERGYASADSAAEELKDYPAGANVRAFVNPDEPAKGFLRCEASVGPMVFVIVGLVVPLAGAILSRWA